MKRISHRIFTTKFKPEAIKLVTEKGLTRVEASGKLDIVLSEPGGPSQASAELKPS